MALKRARIAPDAFGGVERAYSDRAPPPNAPGAILALLALGSMIPDHRQGTAEKKFQKLI